MRLRSALRSAASIGAALLLLAALAALVILDPRVVLVTPPKTHADADVTLPPSDVSLVCLPGPISPEQEASGDEEFGHHSAATRSSLSVSSLPRGDKAAAPATYVRSLSGQSFPLEGTPTGILDADAGGELGLLQASADATSRPALVGSEITLTGGGDLRGLSAHSCSEPSENAWLVGGSTRIGARTDLVIVNPGATNAEVQVDLYSEQGYLEDLSGTTLAVAAKGSQTLSLATLVPDAERLVVHVRASGARVLSALRLSELDGITPLGTGLVTAGAGPASDLTVSGVRASKEAPASLRLLNVTEASVQASVQILSDEDPHDLPGAEDLTLDAGAVTDVSLEGIEEGSAAVRVEANGPLVVGAVTSIAGQEGARSTTWLPSDSVARTLYVPLTFELGVTSRLQLTAGERTSEIGVRFVSAGGDLGQAEEMTLAAHTTRLLTVPKDSRAAIIEGTEPVGAIAQLTATGEGGELGAVLPAAPDSEERRTLEIQIGPYG